MPQAPLAARSRSPVDQELQQLYNDVLAGFDTESPSLSLKDASDIDQIYRVYDDAPGNGNGNMDGGSNGTSYPSVWYTPTSPTSPHNCMLLISAGSLLGLYRRQTRLLAKVVCENSPLHLQFLQQLLPLRPLRSLCRNPNHILIP